MQQENAALIGENIEMVTKEVEPNDLRGNPQTEAYPNLQLLLQPVFAHSSVLGGRVASTNS